jgi:hypothetical protein
MGNSQIYSDFEKHSIIILFVSFIGFALLTMYIWNDNSMVYSLEKDIFVLPGYRALNTGIEQLMNRRTKDLLTETEHERLS